MLRRWVGKVIVHEAGGRGIKSRRVQKKISRQGHLVLVLPPGTKASRLLSRKPSPGSKTRTKGSLEPGQTVQSAVVN